MSDENEELIQDDSILCHTVGLPFRKINTTWPTLVEITILLCFGVSVFVVPYFCPKRDSCAIDALEVLCYCQSCVWVLVLLFDQYYCWQHNVSRLHGYLEFYRKTKISRRLPFYMCSAGCAFLVIMLTLFNRYCNEETCLKPSKVNYLQILVSIQVFLAVLFLIIYLVQGIKFNHRKPSPDVTQDDLFSSFSQNQPPEIGFKDEDHMDEMLEKQADLIRYLKQHNQALGRKIVQLKAQANKK